MLPETDITLDTVHERENHRRNLHSQRGTTRHYSCSGEPPTMILDVVGTMRHLIMGWREIYRRNAKHRKVNGRTELDGSGVYEPSDAYKREDIERLLCSYIVIQLNRN
jgi:hypothetical protein